MGEEMRIGLIYTILSVENKLLLQEAEKKGIELERVVDSELNLEITNKLKEHDLLYQRSVSYTRSLWSTQYFENAGVAVINTFRSQQICGDKALTSQLLAKQGVNTPRTIVAFSEEQALQAIEKLGYPCVIKPVVGSWARMVNKINDRDSAEALLESRKEMGNPWQKIYYIQEYVDKPGRDIRAFLIGDEVVCAIYRTSEHWVTNTARGGTTSNCEVTDELKETVLSAAKLLDPGIYGVDLMEQDGKFTVHEINHSVEFRNSIKPTGVNIPEKMIEFLQQYSKR